MVAITEPDDGELALLMILLDETGIDFAEFALLDSSNPHGRARLRDYQWPYMADDADQQNDLSARDVGKSFSISLRAAVFPFSYPGEHMLLAAPQLNHLQPLLNAVEQRLDSSRILQEIRPKTHGRGITRAPHWEVKFLNGALIVSRLPGRDGIGFKGQHVVKLEVDEAQDLEEQAWKELEPTLKRGTPGAQWRVHGVTRGIRDTFDKLADSPNWRTHKLMAMHRPTWNDAERSSKLEMYGGSSLSADYRRNVYGEPGDQSNALFVLSRFVQCVDYREGSLYNSEIYTAIKVEYEMLDGAPTVQMVMDKFNAVHKATWELAPKGYSAFYGGMDLGVTIDPTEILIFGQRAHLQREALDLLLRVRLLRIPLHEQEEVVREVIRFYGSKLVTFGMDKTGLGVDMYQRLHDGYTTADGVVVPPLGDQIQGFGFGAKYAVMLEDRELEGNEELADLAVERPFIEYASDALREIVDVKGFLLPNDAELLTEWRGETYISVKSKNGMYGKQYGSARSLHTLDAARTFVAGYRLHELHKMLNEKKVQKPVLPFFPGMF